MVLIFTKLITFEHFLIEDDRMYVQICWNFILFVQEVCFLFGLYFEEGIHQMWKCQKSNLSSLFRSHKTCRRLEMVFVWQNGKIKQLLHFNIVLVVSDGPMSGVNNVVSWNIYVQNIYNVACKIIMQIKSSWFK